MRSRRNQATDRRTGRTPCVLSTSPSTVGRQPTSVDTRVSVAKWTSSPHRRAPRTTASLSLWRCRWGSRWSRRMRKSCASSPGWRSTWWLYFRHPDTSSASSAHQPTRVVATASAGFSAAPSNTVQPVSSNGSDQVCCSGSSMAAFCSGQAGSASAIARPPAPASSNRCAVTWPPPRASFLPAVRARVRIPLHCS